jgi:hypothetical protein
VCYFRFRRQSDAAGRPATQPNHGTLAVQSPERSIETEV